ncbi:MAG: methyltransferase [Rhodospirillaceae bacterium]|nr:methyltransferase [Rhodospirillaceae bacterium]MBL6931204.1 methyltransferase [Rhodospirillales bacterium]
MNINPATTEDSLLGGRVRLLQGRDGYRAAIDPVLLAAAIPAVSGQRVLDLGCGTGAASLCLSVRVPGLKISGLDLQPGLIDLARQNAALNECGEDVRFLCGDLLEPPRQITDKPFDHVMVNPPYLEADTGHPPPEPAKAIANVEGAAGLNDWVQAAAAAVVHKGSVTFIHRGDRIDDLLAAFHGCLGGIIVLPLWPGPGKAAKRVIVSGRKGVTSPAQINPGLTLHESNGAFSEAANAILQDASGLSLKA